MPTEKRLGEARSKGKVPRSQELTSVMTLLTLVAAVSLMAPTLLSWFMMQMKLGLSGEADVFSNGQAFMHFVNRKIIDMALVICPILGAVFVGSAMSCILMSGLTYSPQAVKWKFDVINPASGLKSLMNVQSVLRLGLSTLKLLVLSLIMWMYLRDKLETLSTLRWAWSIEIMTAVGHLILGLMIRVGIVLMIIALADAYYRKWKYTEDLKMTKQDVKRENRDKLGSPEVKGKLRRIQYQIAVRRITEEVPKASVVLVNPTHVAVALRYESDTMDAPIVLAKGADHLAEKIREVARAYGVPIIRRPELARALYSTTKIGDVIPDSLYVAVAEVLALIYRLRHSKT
jgi:flagellar biosynthetic protein FlhB